MEPSHEENSRGQGPAPGPVRPDPDAVRAAALAPLWRASAAWGALLLALAAGAPSWTGDPRAALLPGLPGAGALLLFAVGRPARTRRVAMVLTTALAGSVALATSGSLGALGADSGVPRAAVYFQLGCLASAAALLACAVPCWRRVEENGRRADDHLALYEEL
ncbi:MAG: hypothetical protein AAFZ87_00215 [Planctomycetota bacterium]